MVRCLFRLACCAALLAAAAPALAAKVANPRLGEMEEIFFLSGLEAQLEGFGTGLDESLAEQAGAFQGEQLDVLREAVAGAFGAEALRERVRAGLMQQYDARGAAGTLAWLRSPLGRRITRLEAERDADGALAELEAFANRLAQEPPSPTRLALVEALNEATRAIEVTTDLALTASTGVALGANAVQPEGRRASETDLRAAVQAQRPELVSQIGLLVQLSTLQTYESLSDDELGRYVAFSQSEEGRWYNEAVVHELVAALDEAASRIGTEVARKMDAAAAAKVAP